FPEVPALRHTGGTAFSHTALPPLRHTAIGKRDQNSLPRLVQPHANSHPPGRRSNTIVQIHHSRRPAVEPDEAHPNRQSRPKELIMTMPQRRFRQQLAPTGLQPPIEHRGETTMTRLARRILHSPTITTHLKLKPPDSSSGRQT